MEGEEDRLGRALEAVAPWCMAQQYGTRVVAQVSHQLYIFLLLASLYRWLSSKVISQKKLCFTVNQSSDESFARCAFEDFGRSVKSKKRMMLNRRFPQVLAGTIGRQIEA